MTGKSDHMLDSPWYSVRWREESETGMLLLRVHLIIPGGLNRGVVLEVSPNLLYDMSEGSQFPRTRVTQHLLKSQHETFDENQRLKKENERLKRKIEVARQTVQSWSDTAPNAELAEYLRKDG